MGNTSGRDMLCKPTPYLSFAWPAEPWWRKILVVSGGWMGYNSAVSMKLAARQIERFVKQGLDIKRVFERKWCQ